MKIRMKQRFLFLLIWLTTTAGFGQERDSLVQDTLVVGYNISPPFVINDGDLHGPSIWLWEQVAGELEIEYVFVEMPLDSLLSGLSSGKVDVSAAPLTITSERLEKFDFSPAYHIVNSTILVKNGSKAKQALEFLKSFFSIDFFRVLVALFFVILLFGFLTWLFERKKNPVEFGTGLKGIWNGFWWSAVTMTTVGYGDKTPRTVGGKIVALVWMFTAIVIISGFTASITSSLTVNQIGTASNKIEDFKDKKLGTIDESGTEKWLHDNFFTDIYTYPNMSSLLDAFDEDKIDAVAYDQPILSDVKNKDSGKDYNLLNISFNPQFYAMGMDRRLPEDLKHRISVAVLEVVERLDWKVLLTEYDLD